MDFHAHKEQASKATTKFFVYLVLGTIGIAGTLSAITGGYAYIELGGPIGLAVAIATFVGAIVGIASVSIAKGARVRHGGGDHLAASLGGSPINPASHDHVDRRLINITEELAVASGMPVPRLFVLPEEQGINAFSAGWNPDNSVIGVTRGALYYLSRDELQAMVAHEFSHIVTGDTQMKTRAIAWMFGIASIAGAGRDMIQSVKSATARIWVIVALKLFFGTVLICVGYLGAWFARQMQVSINREREHLADAAAVEYTRNPDDLSGVFLKIGSIGERQNLIHSARIAETGHLFFVSPFGGPSDTHPALGKRIRTWLPSWGGRYPALEAVEATANTNIGISVLGAPLPDVGIGVVTHLAQKSADPVGTAMSAAVLAEAIGLDGAGGAGGTGGPRGSDQGPTEDAPDSDRAAVDAAVGPVRGSRIGYAQRVLDAIPDSVRDMLHSPGGAMAAVLGMLVSDNPATRETELAHASDATGFPEQELAEAARMVESLDRSLRLPAIEIALTTIRSSDEELRNGFAATVAELVERSDHIDLFRWLLRRATRRHLLDAYAHDVPQDDVDPQSMVDHAAILYAVFASYNSAGAAGVRDSYAVAYARSGIVPPPPMPADSDLTIGRIDLALDALARMDLASRKAFVEGALAAVDHDSMASTNEVDLVRVVADVLRVDIPPMVALF